MEQIKVLIVDDEVELCIVLKEILENQWNKYDIMAINSARDALSIIKETEMDVVVTDVSMPEMSGIELLREIKSIKKDIQVIVLTGYGDLNNAVEALRLGANNFLKKPVSAKMLHLSVKNAWEKKYGIEKRKIAEDALKKSELLYRTLFNNAGDAVFVHLFGEKFLDVNQVSCDLIGYDTAELMNKRLAEIIAPEYLDTLKQRFSDIKETGCIVFESAFISKTGETIPFEGSSRVIEYEGISAILTIARDIRERKKSEIERNALTYRLQMSQKLESIGTLAGGIAHDFNNILYPIMGYTEMGLKEAVEGSLLKSYLQEILTASYRARNLIQQILTFSRQDEEEKRPVKIQYVVKEVLKLIRSTLPANIDIRTSIQNCRPVLANVGQMHQIIMNLCTNAFHAMSEQGGVIEVIMEELELGPDEVTVFPDLEPAMYLKMIISDTGAGMNPEVIARIFEPYFTTREQGKGTGLGLSVVHGIVRNHGGHINVYSQQNRGTTFHIYLPLISAEIEIPADPLPENDAPGGNEHILLVDDENQIVVMLKLMLEQLGYTITARTSSLEALAVFKACSQNFDLVITDTQMPNMTGLDLAKKILAVRQDMPIVLCTGFSELVTHEKAMKVGIREFIMKPVLKKDMAKIIRKAIDGK